MQLQNVVDVSVLGMQCITFFPSPESLHDALHGWRPPLGVGQALQKLCKTTAQVRMQRCWQSA
jgi:hypothetical protein